MKSFKNYIFLVKSFFSVGKSYSIMLFLSCLVSPILVMIDTTIIKFAIESLEKNRPFIESVCILCAYFFIAFLAHLASILLGRYSCVEIIKIKYKMNLYIYNKALRTDLEYCDDPEYYNNYSWAIQNYFSKSHDAIMLLTKCISVCFNILALASIIISLDAFIIIISFVSVIIEIILSMLNNKLNYEQSLQNIKLSRISSYIHRIFYQNEYSLDIRSIGISNILFSKFRKNTDEQMSLQKKFRNKNALLSFILHINPVLLFIITIIYLLFKGMKNSLQTSDFALLITASQNLTYQLSSLTSIFPELLKQGLFANKLLIFLNLESKIENTNNKMVLENSPTLIEIDNLNFKYPNTSEYILKNINLKINPKEKIAIVGENGAGKSTLLKLLLRLYDPSFGKIMFNGKDLKQYNTKSVRSNIGISLQSTNIFAFTLKENILFDSFIENDQIDLNIKALLDELSMEKYDSKLDTELTREFSENGEVPSGGERQKLGQIRVLHKYFPIYFFDEPTSSIDPLSEKKIMDIIFSKTQKSTVVMIAHRLSTIIDFDKIYVLKGGTIAEYGTHKELMEKRGLYFNMFSQQANAYTSSKECL